MITHLLSGSSQALSQGSTQQASAVEGLSASIIEISDLVERNVENTKDGSRRMGELGREIDYSNEQMAQYHLWNNQVAANVLLADSRLVVAYP